MAEQPGRIRRFVRNTAKHYRVLAKDPEVRSAAKSLAILGGLGLGVHYAPNLQYAAVKLMKRSTKPRGDMRNYLGLYVQGVRATRKARKALWSGKLHPLRMAMRAKRLGITEDMLRENLHRLRGHWIPQHLFRGMHG